MTCRLASVLGEHPNFGCPTGSTARSDRAGCLADLGDGYKVIYCFQHWCPGCHSRGFPALKRLVDGLSDKGFGFAVVQTVFEGADQNTVEKLRETQLHYGLDLPFGH